MKKIKTIVILFSLFSCTGVYSQGGVVGGFNVNAGGMYSSAIGYETQATGSYSFAGGWNAMAEGANSFAFGSLSLASETKSIAIGTNAQVYRPNGIAIGNNAISGMYNAPLSGDYAISIGNYSQAFGDYSMAIGRYVKASNTNSIVIGSGYSSSAPLLNNSSNSLAIGFGSTVPTLFVSSSSGGTSGVGKVGIGTSLPLAPLHLKTGNGETKFDGNGIRYTAAGWNYLTAANSSGGLAFKAGGDDEDDIKMFIASNGNVGIGIGTDVSFPYQLAVNGTIGAKEVIIEEDSPWPTWPDYVFEDSYNLPKLSEIEEFVKEHKHLPEVPSAKDIHENGLNVTEMNAVLLKKIEEMTLHMIELQKQVEKQNKEIEKLKANN